MAGELASCLYVCSRALVILAGRTWATTCMPFSPWVYIFTHNLVKPRN